MNGPLEKPKCMLKEYYTMHIIYSQVGAIYKIGNCLVLMCNLFDHCRFEHKTCFHIWASSRENLSTGFPTTLVSNQSHQLQRLARKLKFRS